MTDNRLISAGREIPTERYSDQPYAVITADGAWLVTITTGAGIEGASGQHIIATRSVDQGRTWSPPVPVEPADGPEASYAVPLKVPSGRIYLFYNHNTDDRRYVKADDPPYRDGKCYRVDSQGCFVFKYSDDHGLTWSAKRYTIPVREMAIDRENPYGGAIRYFWNVGKPFIREGAAYVSLHKVGGLGHGFFTRSEGVLLRSDNILTESDPDAITWETLPDGDAGLRTPPGGGPIAEEQSYCLLSDGSIYSVYRTIDGHPAFAYSRDGGHTWTQPEYKRYANGRLMKHPRAANFAWKCANGKYLYWFHNHGGNWYEDRNPVWLCGGIEVDTPEGRVIAWSQPEIVLYDDDSYVRMSYPDLVEDQGNTYLLETQKDKARVHLLDQSLLDGLWGQLEGESGLTTSGCIAEWNAENDSDNHVVIPLCPHSSPAIISGPITARKICAAVSAWISGCSCKASMAASCFWTRARPMVKVGRCTRPRAEQLKSSSTTAGPKIAGIATPACCVRGSSSTWRSWLTEVQRSSPFSSTASCATAATIANLAGGVSVPPCGTSTAHPGIPSSRREARACKMARPSPATPNASTSERESVRCASTIAICAHPR